MAILYLPYKEYMAVVYATVAQRPASLSAGFSTVSMRPQLHSWDGGASLEGVSEMARVEVQRRIAATAELVCWSMDDELDLDVEFRPWGKPYAMFEDYLPAQLRRP